MTAQPTGAGTRTGLPQVPKGFAEGLVTHSLALADKGFFLQCLHLGKGVPSLPLSLPNPCGFPLRVLLILASTYLLDPSAIPIFEALAPPRSLPGPECSLAPRVTY